MRLRLLILILAVPFLLVGQDFPKHKIGKEFSSVFQRLISGQFIGTVNGLLIVTNPEQVEVILDFQGSYSQLIIEPDKDSIYDISTKIYKARTTSGKTEIEYRTYAGSNSIAIKVFENWFELSFIDGACMEVIDGLDYEYKTEKTTEYLTLQIFSELKLSNSQFIFRTEHTMNPDNILELKAKIKTISILPNSVLVFAIKRG